MACLPHRERGFARGDHQPARRMRGRHRGAGSGERNRQRKRRIALLTILASATLGLVGPAGARTKSADDAARVPVARRLERAAQLALAHDLADDGRTSARERKPILLFFDREECPYCEQALREYLVPMSREEWKDRALFRQVEIDRPLPLTDFDGSVTTHERLAARFGVVALADGARRRRSRSDPRRAARRPDDRRLLRRVPRERARRGREKARRLISRSASRGRVDPAQSSRQPIAAQGTRRTAPQLPGESFAAPPGQSHRYFLAASWILSPAFSTCWPTLSTALSTCLPARSAGPSSLASADDGDQGDRCDRGGDPTGVARHCGSSCLTTKSALCPTPMLSFQVAKTGFAGTAIIRSVHLPGTPRHAHRHFRRRRIPRPQAGERDSRGRSLDRRNRCDSRGSRARPGRRRHTAIFRRPARSRCCGRSCG